MNANTTLIERLNTCIKAAKEKLNEVESFEIDEENWEDSYIECLNESGEINICGYKYDPAYALKELDPTAYRCGLLDYVNNIDRSDDDSFKSLLETLDELRADLDEAIDDAQILADDFDEPDTEDAELVAAVERGTVVLNNIDSL